MSNSHTLRTLVNERLTAAAEEIFALFETTIAAYEKELCRSKEENQRKQQLLDSAKAALSPGVRQQLVAGVPIPSTSPSLVLNPEITKIVIKEESEVQISVKQEEEELLVPVPESSVVYMKREEASTLQRRQTEQIKETWGKDISSETHLHPVREGYTLHSDSPEPCGPPFNFSSAQREVGTDGETSSTVNSGEESETKKHQCSVCQKRFTRKQHLDLHRRVHSGEKPFSCTVCNRTFALKGTLEVHMRTHTGERPYCCPICKKTFTQTSALNSHRRTHTGEKPFGCPTCKKTFGQKVHLEVHMRSHTGERPYCCSFCTKPFADSYNLKIHMRVHTGEKPYRCSVCQKGFTVSSNLRAHERTHTNL